MIELIIKINTMANYDINSSETFTNWYVITGAPCSGKTAVIDQLAGQGYQTVTEVARAYIDAQLAQGLSLEAVKADVPAFERHILMEKVRIEKRLPREEVIFFDRAVPDSIAYYRLEGLDPAEPIRYSTQHYQKVFLFEALQFKKDAVRTENQKISSRIEALLLDAYTALGYKVVGVPIMSVTQRVEFVLSQTGAH